MRLLLFCGEICSWLSNRKDIQCYKQNPNPIKPSTTITNIRMNMRTKWGNSTFVGCCGSKKNGKKMWNEMQLSVVNWIHLLKSIVLWSKSSPQPNSNVMKAWTNHLIKETQPQDPGNPLIPFYQQGKKKNAAKKTSTFIPTESITGKERQTYSEHLCVRQNWNSTGK